MSIFYSFTFLPLKASTTRDAKSAAYCRQNGDDEIDDGLPSFFFHSLSLI